MGNRKALARKVFSQSIRRSLQAFTTRWSKRRCQTANRTESNGAGLIIAVAAPTCGAGASSVAAHLAGVIAECGQKTVLVDANWRKPSAARFALNAEPSRKLARALVTVHLELKSFDVLVHCVRQVQSRN